MGSSKAMQQAKSDRQLIAVLLIAAFFLSACSTLVARVSEKPEGAKVTPEARELLALLANQNKDLASFKGIGRITFQRNNKKELDARVLWVGSVPDKLRLAVNSFSGQPVISFASDGQWYYVFSHSDSRYDKKRASTASLKRLFSIPINSDDIVNLLAGRTPLKAYQRASVESKGSEGNYVLILERRRGSDLEKIYFDENKHRVRKVEMFDFSGALLYRVQFCGMQIIKKYQVPACLMIGDKEGREVKLDIEMYWADVAVSSSAFVLAPPE